MFVPFIPLSTYTASPPAELNCLHVSTVQPSITVSTATPKTSIPLPLGLRDFQPTKDVYGDLILYPNEPVLPVAGTPPIAVHDDNTMFLQACWVSKWALSVLSLVQFV